MGPTLIRIDVLYDWLDKYAKFLESYAKGGFLSPYHEGALDTVHNIKQILVEFEEKEGEE